MTYRDYILEIKKEDLNKKNIVYKWLITLRNGKTYSYYGISTRDLKSRTEEHIRDKRTPFDKFLTMYKEEITAIKIDVLKEYKRNYKDIKKRLEAVETKTIGNAQLTDRYNLNVRQVQLGLHLIGA